MRISFSQVLSVSVDQCRFYVGKKPSANFGKLSAAAAAAAVVVIVIVAVAAVFRLPHQHDTTSQHAQEC
jgi:hypothetical protein